MREILFKAKRIDNGEWVDGYVVRKHGLYFIYSIVNSESCIQNNYEIAQETICTFTGFYDKNGNRIWDNDIVNTNSNVRAQIKFGLYSNSFSTRKHNQGFYMDFMDKEYYHHELGCWAGKSVVIVNIFDNKELLQEEVDE